MMFTLLLDVLLLKYSDVKLTILKNYDIKLIYLELHDKRIKEGEKDIHRHIHNKIRKESS